MIVEDKEAEDSWTPKSYPIPKHWLYTELEVAFENIPLTGKKLAQKNYEVQGDFPVVDQGASEVGGYSNDKNKLINIERPVIVFGDHTKCLKYINFSFIPGADGVKVLMPRSPIDPKYAFYACRSLQLPDRGYSRHYSFLKKCNFPLAPLNEQKRIVAKLEELFSELDKGTEALKTAREQLKVYRHSLLKHAFEGKLTTKWREENKDKLESPEIRLDRIKHERETRYNQQIKIWQAAVKKWEGLGGLDKKPTKPRKPEQPLAPNSDYLSKMWELPESWAWSQIGKFSFVTKLAGFEYTKFVTYDVMGDLPVLKAENAGIAGFKVTEFSRVHSSSVISLTRSFLNGGELLMVFVGAGTGNVAMVPLNQQYFLGPNVGMIRLETKLINPRFLELFLRSPKGKDLVLSASKAVAQPSLSMGTIRQTPVAIPSLLEQNEIVMVLEDQIPLIEKEEADIDKTLLMASNLRQSILKKAFSGQLVPQVPDDEPAEKLLERIISQKNKARA